MATSGKVLSICTKSSESKHSVGFGLDNGLSPIRRWAIIYTNTD